CRQFACNKSLISSEGVLYLFFVTSPLEASDAASPTSRAIQFHDHARASQSAEVGATTTRSDGPANRHHGPRDRRQNIADELEDRGGASFCWRGWQRYWTSQRRGGKKRPSHFPSLGPFFSYCSRQWGGLTITRRRQQSSHGLWKSTARN